MCVQGHATDTYTEFAEQNKELLATMPPPLVALNYYKSGEAPRVAAAQCSGQRTLQRPTRRLPAHPSTGDLYLFDEFQTSFKGREPRRPACK